MHVNASDTYTSDCLSKIQLSNIYQSGLYKEEYTGLFPTISHLYDLTLFLIQMLSDAFAADFFPVNYQSITRSDITLIQSVVS